MNRRLFWKLCLTFVTGIVAMFYLINQLTFKAEEDMSLLDEVHRDELKFWGKQADSLYASGDILALETWLNTLQTQEKTWAAVVKYDIQHIVGNELSEQSYTGFNLGRNVNWKIHLYFEENPVMEIPFDGGKASFLILLPDRMLPGSHWQATRFTLQVFLPMTLLAILSILLYRHIMQPLRKLEQATREFSRGDFSVRVSKLLGNRNDEMSELANTFDQMASRIGDQIVSQRQLIADLSHELRTSLSRLDMALEAHNNKAKNTNLDRVSRESRHIRSLVEDTLTLAWLENEHPNLVQEDLDLVDLIDVIIDDAKFEFPDRVIHASLPESAPLKGSNHRAVGQALENIVRNALRFTPKGMEINVSLKSLGQTYLIEVKDQGSGVPKELLETIFQPFFRVDKSRTSDDSGFGLGLALARRQLNSVGGEVFASNRSLKGLCMSVTLPYSTPN